MPLNLRKSSTHVKDKERVLRAHDLNRADGGYLGRLLVPPSVTALRPGDLAASPLQDKNMFDERALLKSGIDD